MKFGWILFVAIFVLGACGKPKPLTGDQRDQLSKVMNGVSDTLGAIQKSAEGKTGTSSSALLDSGVSSLLSTSVAADSEDENETVRQSDIEEKLESGNCDIQAADASDDSIITEAANFTVRGDSCPVHAQFRLTSESDPNNALVTVQLGMEFDVRDDELKQGLPVYYYSLSSEIQVRNTERADGTISGVIKTHEFGDIQIEGNVEARQNSNSVKIRVVYHFPDFEVVLEKIEKDGDETYLINGEPSTKSEFERLGQY